MSVTTFNCPGFAGNENGDGLDVGSSGNTIPVIVHEVKDRVRILCVALVDGKCRQAEGEISNVDTPEDADIKWEDCPYVRLTRDESEGSSESEAADESESRDESEAADTKSQLSSSEIDILNGKAIR